MGMIIGKIAERKAQDAAAMKRMLEYLASDRCPEYLTNAHKRSMGLIEDQDEDEELEKVEVVDDEETALANSMQGFGFEDLDDDQGDDDEDPDSDEDDMVNEKPGSRQDYPLHEAAKTNSYYKVSNCLRNVRVSVELVDGDGKTALYICAEKGNPLTVKLMLQAGAKPYHRTTFGWCPIHAACFGGHARAVEVLIEKNAAINQRDAEGVTPLMLIASSFRLYRDDLMTKQEKLLRERAKARAFDYETRARLLEQFGPKMDPVKTFDILCKLRAGFQVFEEEMRPRLLTIWERQQGVPDHELHRRQLFYQKEQENAVAAVLRYWEYSQHQIEMVLIKLLVGTGSNKLDANLVDKKGRAALQYCSADGYCQVISRLLELKAKVDHKDNMGQTAVFAACKRGQVRSLAMLLCAGAKVDIHDCFYTYPIHVIVEGNHENVTQMLIRTNASVNVYDAQGRTPLMFAMDANNARMVRLILQEKPEVNIVDARGWNIFIYAVETGLLKELGEVLLAFGDKIRHVVGWKDPQGSCALHHAVSCGAFYDVELLCRILPNVTEPDCNGNNALHLCCCEGSGIILKHLLEFIFTNTVAVVIDQAEQEREERRKRMKEQQKSAQQAFYAQAGSNIEVVRTIPMKEYVRKRNLAEKEADILTLEERKQKRMQEEKGEEAMTLDFKNLRGETPLLLACAKGNLNCVVMLLNRRNPVVADSSIIDNDKRNILHHAATGRNLDLVNLILMNKDVDMMHGQPNEKLAFRTVNVNAQDIDGTTAVMIAAREGNWNLIPGLVVAGASLNMKDKDEYTALHWACHEGEGDAVAVLLDCKANIDELDSANWTPLMLATHVGCNEACQLLIDNNADLLKQNNMAQTAYDLAREGAIAQEKELDISDGNFRALVDVICDGLRDADLKTGLIAKHLHTGIDANGTLILSLLHARYLSCAGMDSLGLNTYAYVQFAEHPNENSMVCMSSCCLSNPHPTWNEVFQFQLSKLHPMSFISIHFLGTMTTRVQDHLKEKIFTEDDGGTTVAGQSSVEVGGVEEDTEDLKGKGIMINKDGKAVKMDKADVQMSQAADAVASGESGFASEIEAERAKFPGDAATKQLRVKSSHDRVWLSLKNFHENVRKRGYNNVSMPAVPKDHIPLGVIFITFRALREVAWNEGVFEYDRPLRLSQQARCRFDLEFRPRYWKPKATIDQSQLKRFNVPTKQEIESSAEFVNYVDGSRDPPNKEVPEVDPRTQQSREVLLNKDIMFSSRKARKAVVASQERHERAKQYGVRTKVKRVRNPFSEFSRMFQFGKTAVQYEAEKYQVKQAWDAKVPKQSNFGERKFDLPPAPMPDHLKIPPNIDIAPDDGRKLANSGFTMPCNIR